MNFLSFLRNFRHGFIGSENKLFIATSELASRSSEYPFSISDVLVGEYPKPPTARSAFGRTCLSARLYRSRWSLIPAHPRGKNGARFPRQPRRSRRVSHSSAVTSTSITSLWPSGMARIILLCTRTEYPLMLHFVPSRVG